MAFYALCGLMGYVLSTVNINITDWQFWVAVVCMCGAHYCGKESKKR